MEAKMKLFAAATLCLLIGAPTFAYQEQQQQQEEKQKPPQEPKADKKQEEPTKQEEKAKQNQEDKVKQTKQQQEAAKQQEKQQKQAEKQQKVQEKQERQQDEHSRVGQQRGAPETAAAPAHGGRRIPDDKFHAEFGREHHFHIRIHSGETRFVYGGYSFEYIGAWPVGWGYGDEFYIELIGDDYYLCDVEHPEVQLIVIVVG
jgi:hypothetical protein